MEVQSCWRASEDRRLAAERTVDEAVAAGVAVSCPGQHSIYIESSAIAVPYPRHARQFPMKIKDRHAEAECSQR